MPLIAPTSIMALPLPTLSSFEEYSSLTKTVYPYIPQLYELPRQLLAAGTDTAALTEIYIRTNPLISTAAIAIILTPFVWAASEINKNYSQVDRLWSILPTLYISNYILYAHVVGMDTERLDMLGIAYGIWSARLTFNYWRKGGYTIGSEDYRWCVPRLPPLSVPSTLNLTQCSSDILTTKQDDSKELRQQRSHLVRLQPHLHRHLPDDPPLYDLGASLHSPPRNIQGYANGTHRYRGSKTCHRVGDIGVHGRSATME